MSFKIAFIGAGSIGFTRKLLSDILTVPEFHDIEVAFTDINPDNLRMVTTLCQRDIDENGLSIKIEATLDRRKAFENAKYVINCVRIGMLEAFATDIDIPLKYGVDQCVGDTLCIGGIMYGQRGVAAVLDFCKDIREVAAPGYITQEENPGYFTDDLSTTLITFKNGVTCTMMTGCYSLNGASWDSKMTFGSRSSRMDYVLCSKVTLYGVTEEDKAADVAGTISGDGTQRKSENEVGVTYRNTIDFGVKCDRTFIDAVLTGDPSKIRSPYADAYKSVAFTLACNKSMETGMPVKVEY